MARTKRICEPCPRNYNRPCVMKTIMFLRLTFSINLLFMHSNSGVDRNEFIHLLQQTTV